MADNKRRSDLVRKQFMLTKAQVNYLAQISKQTGDSEARFVRQALDVFAKSFPVSKKP
jgi:hypothetical protein